MSDFLNSRVKKAVSEKKTLETKMNNPNSSQPEKYVEKSNNWDRHFGENMGTIRFSDGKEHDRQELVDFGGDALNNVFMNALNGQYKAFVDRHEVKAGRDKSELPNKLKELGTTAWEIAKLAKTAKSRDEFAKLDTLRSDFQDIFSNVNKDMHAYGKDYGMVFNEDFKMVTPEKLAEFSQQAVVRETSSTDQQVTSDINTDLIIWGGLKSILAPGSSGFATIRQGLGNKKAIHNNKSAYQKIQTKVTDMRDILTEAYTPIIDSWVDYGFSNWSNDRFGSNVGKYDNRESIVALSTSALLHISKYGTSNKPDQELAKKLFHEMEKASSVDERQQFYKTHELEMKGLIKRIGHYGKKMLLNKHQDNFNSSQYYPGDDSKTKERNMTTYLNEIKTLTAQKEKTDNIFSQVKLKAIEELRLDLRNTSSRYGSVENSAKGIESLLADVMFTEGETRMGDDGLLSNVHVTSSGKLRSFNDLMKDFRNQGTTKNRNGVTLYRVPKGIGTTKDLDNDWVTWNNLKDAYDDVAKKYREKFNDLKSEEIFSESLLVLGLGKNRSQHIGHDNIDFKNTSGKNRNAHTIKNLLESELKNGTAFVKKGTIDASITESELASTLVPSRIDMLDSFLKDDRKYDVTFSRNTPIKNKSSYTFTTKGKSPKSMTFYVNTKAAEQADEKYSKLSYTSPQEYSYKISGSWDLSAWDGMFEYSEKAQIITKDGMKYLKATMYNIKQEMPVSELIPLGPDGSIQVQKAEEMAKSILSKYDQDLKNYLNY